MLARVLENLIPVPRTVKILLLKIQDDCRMLLLGTSNPGGTRVGEPMNQMVVFDALCTEDIRIANESCGWAHILEAEVYV